MNRSNSSGRRGAGTRVIAVMNQKGGVGKTTTTVNLGAALALKGKRVLLVDMDPQAHMTLHVGVNPEELESSLYDLLTDPKVKAGEVIQEVRDNLYLLPGEVNLAGVESELGGMVSQGKVQHILKDKLGFILGIRAGEAAAVMTVQGNSVGSRSDTGGIEEEERPSGSESDETYDFVLIDCPPSLGLLTVNALAVASEVFVPLQAHFLALQGLSKLLTTVSMVKESINPGLNVSGLVLCLHEGHTVLAGEVMADLDGFLAGARGRGLPWSDAAMLKPAIKRNIKLAESPSFGKTIFDYAPLCPGAQDYRQLAEAVMKM